MQRGRLKWQSSVGMAPGYPVKQQQEEHHLSRLLRISKRNICNSPLYTCISGCLIIMGGASLIAQLVKNLPATQETPVWSWVRKIPWRRIGYPLQYSGLENSMGPWGRKELGTTEQLSLSLFLWKGASVLGVFSPAKAFSLWLALKRLGMSTTNERSKRTLNAGLI